MSAKKKVVRQAIGDGSAKKPVARPKDSTTAKKSVAVSWYAGFKPYKEKAGEEYMNTAQAEHFRRILQSWRQELIDEIARTVSHLQDDAGNFADPNDRATQEEEFALELRTRDRERKLIKKIGESLANLDSREYGFCEVCGVEIGIRRLEARPTATLCIDCKTLEEIREKQLS